MCSPAMRVFAWISPLLKRALIMIHAYPQSLLMRIGVWGLLDAWNGSFFLGDIFTIALVFSWLRDLFHLLRYGRAGMHSQGEY